MHSICYCVKGQDTSHHEDRRTHATFHQGHSPFKVDVHTNTHTHTWPNYLAACLRCVRGALPRVRPGKPRIVRITITFSFSPLAVESLAIVAKVSQASLHARHSWDLSGVVGGYIFGDKWIDSIIILKYLIRYTKVVLRT